MSTDPIKLQFRCPECEASGLTPEMPEEKAIAVIRGELSLRCPRCSAIIEVTEPLGRVIWQAGLKKAEDSLREALKARLERRTHGSRRRKRLGGQGGAADGSQPSSSDPDRAPGAADSRR